MRALYSLLMWLATPFALGYFSVRGLRDRRWFEDWPGRLGLGSGAACSLHVHCASVGEVNAAAPLVRGLLERPECTPMLLTVFTPTGAERAAIASRCATRHSTCRERPGGCWRRGDRAPSW